MAILPKVAGQAAELASIQRRRLEETTARMVERMCDGMLRAHRRSMTRSRAEGAAMGAFLALTDSAVTALAATCRPPSRAWQEWRGTRRRLTA